MGKQGDARVCLIDFIYDKCLRDKITRKRCKIGAN